MIVGSVLALAATESSAVQRDAAGEAAPRLELRPARSEHVVAPGGTTTVRLTVRNRLDEAVTWRVLAVDLGAGRAGSFARPVQARPGRSAVPWFTLPPDRVRLTPGQSRRVETRVDVPAAARPGTYAVALVVSQRFGAITGDGAEVVGSRVQLDADLASTVVLQVTGDARSAARITSVDAPGVVWRDRTPRIDVHVRNSGDTLLDLEAGVRLRSFGLGASRELRSAERPTLPDGDRTLTTRWEDPPLVGWFRPQLVVVGGDGSGVRLERTLPGVLVLPPWWLLALVLLAIVGPVTARRRRRR